MNQNALRKERNLLRESDPGKESMFEMVPTYLDIEKVPWFDSKGIAEAVHQFKEGKNDYISKEKSKEDEINEEDIKKILDEMLKNFK